MSRYLLLVCLFTLGIACSNGAPTVAGDSQSADSSVNGVDQHSTDQHTLPDSQPAVDTSGPAVDSTQPGDSVLAADLAVTADVAPNDTAGADVSVADSLAPQTTGTLYPTDRIHSPLTPAIKANLRAIFAKGQLNGQRAHVFAKLGASFEDSVTTFAGCMVTGALNLDGRTALQTTIDHFAKPISAELGDSNAWDRDSKAAISGWAAVDGLTTMIDGKSAIAYELDLLKPAFALIAYNGNDVGKSTIEQYHDNLTTIIEICLDRGIIPILRTKPREETSSTTRPRKIIQFNAVIRGLSQRYQLPFLDLNLAVRDVAEALGSDGLHLSTYSNNGTKNCWFTDEGLQKGKPVYNLIFLEALDRVRRVVIDDESAPDQPTAVVGEGTNALPFMATLGDDQLQFVNDPGSNAQTIPLYTLTHVADTSASTQHLFDSYSCGSQSESGNEVVYRVDVPTGPNGESLSGKLTVRLFEKSGIDVDLHWLTSLDASSCVARDNDTLTLSNVSSGSYYLLFDTFTSSGGENKPGAVLFFAIFEPGL